MEVRGQEKEMGMPRRRDQSVVSDAVLPQSLDHHHHHHPVYHHQVNPHINKAGRNPEPDPDPVPAPAATPVANRSSLKSPQPAPTPPQPSPAPPATTSATLVRYRECMKNHAAATGGHVLDGCGEFMPRGEEGTPQALKCAACDCHRSFHRKEINGESHYTPNSYYTYIPNKNSTSRESIPALPLHRLSHGFSISAPSTVPIAPVMMAFGAGNGGGPAESSSEDLIVYQPNAAGQSSVQPPSSKKRFRTKFNQEQKDKMMEFAEKLEWKIQKQDEEEVQQFCAQVGVKRQVFKVWMHNNKQATKKKQM